MEGVLGPLDAGDIIWKLFDDPSRESLSELSWATSIQESVGFWVVSIMVSDVKS